MAAGHYRQAYDCAIDGLAETPEAAIHGVLAQYAGRAAWKLQRPDLSMRYFGEAVEVLAHVDAPEVLFTAQLDYGLALYEHGLHEAALDQYLAAKSNAPDDDASTLRVLDRRIAALMLDEGRYDEALAVLGPAPPEEASAQDRFAWLNYRLLWAERTGRIAEAQVLATQMRTIWESHSDDPAILQMAGGILNALRLDAILRGAAFVSDELQRLADLPDAALSLNLRIRLEDLRAELALDKGETQTAFDIIDGAIARAIEVYGDVPPELILRRKAVLDRVGQGAAFVPYLDGLQDGALTEGRFPLDDVTVETAPLLVAVLEQSDIQRDLPDFTRNGAIHLLQLASAGLPAETRWQAYACLAELITDRRSRILMAKMACNQIAKTAASALTFRGAYATFLRARIAPFQRAIALLYDADRLHEGRQIADMALGLKRQLALLRSQNGETLLEIPLTPQEATAVVALQTDKDAACQIVDGTYWPSGVPAQPRQPLIQTTRSIIRFSRTTDGYLRDAGAPGGSDVIRLDVSVAELAARTADLLQLLEAGQCGRAVAADLYNMLIAPVDTMLPPPLPVMIQADGVLGAVPFAALFATAAARPVIYATGGVRGRLVSAPYRSAIHLTGTADLAGMITETTALKETVQVRAEPLSLVSLNTALVAAPDILHISCHFVLQPTRPRRSRLLTGPGLPDVTADEVVAALTASAARRPRLVFLAFCDSAVSVEGEGQTTDLPGLLLSEGVEAVIAAAWKVPDFEAARFARALYTDLGQGAALTEAFAKAEAATGFHGFKLFLGAMPPTHEEGAQRSTNKPIQSLGRR